MTSAGLSNSSSKSADQISYNTADAAQAVTPHAAHEPASFAVFSSLKALHVNITPQEHGYAAHRKSKSIPNSSLKQQDVFWSKMDESRPCGVKTKIKTTCLRLCHWNFWHQRTPRELIVARQQTFDLPSGQKQLENMRQRPTTNSPVRSDGCRRC
jgi:hypothetical protein